jgi:UDP-N-acetylmuramate--alanine ligase
MAPLAVVLADVYGANVTGSDKTTTGHAAENVHGADFVVRTSAAHGDNPEVVETLRLNIPLLERAEVWGMIMREYPTAICVAGTHGKSTTTAMLAQILITAGLDPSVMVGAAFPFIGGNHRTGKREYFIAEADEFSRSFYHFHPKIALILNIEFDHPDCFADLADLQAAFAKFASQAEIVVDSYSEADLPDGVTLKVPGKFNRLNAAAASKVARLCGISDTDIRRALEAFTGTSRRYEYKGKLNGADFYDDYAHHPTELTATLTMARELLERGTYKRLVVAFQPHTFTRTKALLHEFADALKLADKVLLAEIFPSREPDIYNVHSKDLAALVPGSECFSALTEVAARLRELAESGDLVMTIGAGDITTVWSLIVNH